VRSMPAWLGPAARPCRAGVAGGPGRGDVQRPAALTCCGRHARPVRHPPAARRRCLALGGFHRDAAVSEEELRAPYEPGNSALQDVAPGPAAVRAGSEVHVEGSHMPAGASAFPSLSSGRKRSCIPETCCSMSLAVQRSTRMASLPCRPHGQVVQSNHYLAVPPCATTRRSPLSDSP
jgi:hypothetical protein